MNNITKLDTLLLEKQSELAPHFKPGFLPREHTVFQFHFDEGDSFFLEVQAEIFELKSGVTVSPTITINIRSHEICWGLLEGRIDGMKAFMEQNYRADGNIVLSQLLLYLFKSTDPTIVYEVKY